MTLPSLEDRLARVLADATDDLPAPHLAGGAWSLARVVRRRRRRAATGVCALGAAAAVAAALVLPGVLSTTARPAGIAVTPRPAPAPAHQGATSEASWDPATYASLPALDLGLGDLRPDPDTAAPIAQAPLDRAVAVVKEYGAGGTFYALGEDGRWRSVDTGAPADIDNSGAAGQPHEPPLRGPLLRPGALSGDGRYVVLEGHTFVEVYDLASATGSRVNGEWFDEIWSPTDTLLLKSAGGVTSYDPTTGARANSDVDLGPADRPIVGGFTADGRFVDLSEDRYYVARPRRADPGHDPVVITATDAAVGDDRVALAEAAGLDARTGTGDNDATPPPHGLGMLTIRASDDYLALTERLVPRFWLDQDTLVFSVRPDHGPGSHTWDTPGAQLLVAWTPATGRLQRIASTTNQWRDLSLAGDLLGGH